MKATEHQKEMMRKYHSEHREEMKIKKHEWYMRNRERMCNFMREYRKRNKNEIKKSLQERHPLVHIHAMILQRCGIRKYKNEYILSRYARRGITVCEEWINLSSFENWALSHGWRKELQIDRIDNNKGYCPNNCRFVSCKENCRNRSSNRIIEYNGERKPLVMFVEEGKTKLGYDATLKRIRNGWNVVDAFETPRVTNQYRKESKNAKSRSL